MYSITLIQQEPSDKVSYHIIEEAEQALKQTLNCLTVPENPLPRPLKALYKLSEPLLSMLPKPTAYLAILMGVPHLYKTYPYFAFAARGKALYIYDCWAYQYAALLIAIKKYRITNIFISAKQPAAELTALVPGFCTVTWLPEAIDPAHAYHPAEAKSYDVIQFGRKYAPYHEAIRTGGFAYVHEKIPTHEEFCRTLAQSKISVCFPSSLTNPERSGSVSTMTVRYLQSMLSKCLIVGRMPDDMQELFDYCPIVEADLKNPVEQLRDILAHYDDYTELIERNYREVLSKHTWTQRAQVIKQYLS